MPFIISFLVNFIIEIKYYIGYPNEVLRGVLVAVKEGNLVETNSVLLNSMSSLKFPSNGEVNVESAVPLAPYGKIYYEIIVYFFFFFNENTVSKM